MFTASLVSSTEFQDSLSYTEGLLSQGGVEGSVNSGFCKAIWSKFLKNK